MATPYQYMLLTATPEKEARFAALKKKYKTAGFVRTRMTSDELEQTRIFLGIPWFAHGKLALNSS